MQRIVISVSVFTIALLFAFSSFVEAHPGRLDSSGGHNCSESAKSKGLCTGYHYHDKQGKPVYPNSAKKPSTSKPSQQKTEIIVQVKGEKLSFPHQSPIIKNGSTLVPMRAIFESLDASVAWDKANLKVTGKKGNSDVVLYINKKEATVNGKKILLSQPAELLNGTTLVPLRFISESLGANVNWNNTTKTVTIN